ncbi:iron transporter [Halorubellus salinus]|uniref:iron transporter n=1 Tax=Halorubellus salinus TaxID=755309 RepID=UPI001D0633E9|nr:iron transporter [Halorubellus salinus]
MRRRSLLARVARTAGVAVAATGTAASAGCLATGSDDYVPPPRVEDPPQGVYRPVAAPRLRTVGVADAGPFRLALAYGPPVRFWEVVGEQTYRRAVESEDDVHLVALAWDPETGVVLPEVGLTVEVTRDDALVAQEAVYAMVSQGMGFHYGDNFALDGDGAYAATVAVGGLQGRRTGAFAGRFGEPASHTFAFEYARSDRDALEVVRADDPGTRGALPTTPPGSMPAAAVPADPPGSRLGRATTADVAFDVRALTGRAATERVDADAPADAAYLAVLAHTPYNDLVLPAMGLRATVEREDGATTERILDRTLDPELGYHYGASVDGLVDATAVGIEPLTPPQVARHEGYETAFLDVEPVRVTVD